MKKRNRTGEERRRQTLFGKRDCNFVWKNFPPDVNILDTDFKKKKKKKSITRQNMSHTSVFYASFSSFCHPLRKVTGITCQKGFPQSRERRSISIFSLKEVITRKRWLFNSKQLVIVSTFASRLNKESMCTGFPTPSHCFAAQVTSLLLSTHCYNSP